VARSGAKGRSPPEDGGASWELAAVARFFGRYEHTLDDKGRVILPARFRSFFEHGGYLAQHHDGCLALWTPDEFESQLERMRERQGQGRSQRNQARFWAQASLDVEIDRQGRLAVPQRMRGYAGLMDDVLVLGAIDRIELWNPSTWDEKVGPEEQRLVDGVDL
jgi:MraZ protein